MTELLLEIPVSVSDIMDRYLMDGEDIKISLPAAGGALVATNKRVFIFNEDESGNPQIDNCLLGAVLGAEAKQQGLGGAIMFKTVSSVSLSEVNFPQKYLDNYKEAAMFFNQSAKEHTISSAKDEKCPKCGAYTPSGSVFCPSCGVQVSAVCSTCSAACDPNSKYCHRCGAMLNSFEVSCIRCGSRIAKWMAFCPMCGTMIGRKCPTCQTEMLTSWVHCPTCGRRPADGVPQNRFRKQEQNDTQTDSDDLSMAQMHNKKGMELFENNDTEGALKEFEAACELESTNTLFLCNLAVAYDENEDTDASKMLYEKVLSIDPNDLCALLNLGYIYNENGSQKCAKVMWEKIIKIDPSSSEADDAREALEHIGQV